MNEDEIARAVKRALLDRKKPGPWLFEWVTDNFTIPSGEIWDCYFGLDAADAEAAPSVQIMDPGAPNGQTDLVTNDDFPIYHICPYYPALPVYFFAFDKIDPATGIVEWGGIQVDSISNITSAGAIHYCRAPPIRLYGGQKIFSGSANKFGFYHRRRYDLE